MKPIRLLYVTGTLEMGGYETLVRNWCDRLHGNGFTCSVACMLGKRGPYVDDLERMGVSVYDVDQGRRGFIRRLARAVRAAEADLIHSQCGWSLPQQILGARWGHQAPFVLTIHSTYPFGTPFQTLRRVLGLRPLLKCVPAIVGISAAVSEHTRRWLQIAPARVKTIYNGIPTERFGPLRKDREAERGRLGLAPGGRLVVCVASFTPEKGHETLLRAAAALQGRRPEMQYAFVGSGPLRESLQRLTAQLGLADRVRFLGSRRDVAQILAVGDVFALASQWEGFGLAIAEASAAALPVVATRVGGIPEVVEHGRTGLLVVPGDPAALAAALEQLAARPDLARSFGEAGRERVCECFDLRRCTDEYVALYRSILQP